MFMEYLIGVGVALLVCAFGLVAGFDRDRAFYATMVIVVAHYYILFAAMGASIPILAIESAVACVFLLVAVAGFRRNLWWAAAALAGHGVFDSVHRFFIENPGVPIWWPGFCGAFDVLAAAFLALLLMRRPGFALTA